MKQSVIGKGLLALVLVLMFVMPGISYAEGLPPNSSSLDDGSIILQNEETEIKEVTATITLGRLNINGILPGPGNEKAVLTSILSYISNPLSEHVRGKATVQVYGSALPLARAYTTLLRNGSQEETTYPSYVCWTSGSNPCTSQTREWLGYHAHWQNVAETDVYWSGGGSAHGSAVVSKQF